MSASANVFSGSFAEVYDRYLVRMDFAPHGRRIAECVRVLSPRSVLETAAGTGVVTRELARILPLDATITATDLNQPMLTLAQTHIDSERIRWQQADALDLPFRDGEFDVVVCQFGVMFFPDKHQGFREALRVLRPGGRFLFNLWDGFEANTNSPLRIAARVVGRIVGRDPVSLLSPPYYDDLVIQSDLTTVGFINMQIERVTEASRAASAGDAAKIVCHGSMLRTAIDAYDPSRLDEVTEQVTEALLSRFGMRPVEGVTQAVLVSAERP